MRIAIHTLGTRGDMQPYVALALGLRARGHEVQIAAPARFADFATGRGLGFAPLPAEFLEMMNTPEGKAAIGGGEGFSAGFKLLKQARPLMRSLLDLEWAAAKSFSPQVIVGHPKSLAAPHIGEALGIPAVLASPLPGFTPTSAFPSPLLPFADLGPLNRPSHALAIRGGEMLFGRALAEWRTGVLGVAAKPKRRLEPAGVLYAYSPQVVPVPPDWTSNVLVSGYWFLDDPDWQMPASLRAFISAGPPPVYVGFGSMPGLDPAALTEAVVGGVARAGKRAILATGGGALDGHAAPHVHMIDGAPHDRLFGLVSATVHHGGAGTTGASLRAGVPTTIMPFFGDQPFWARRVATLGVGPAPLDRRRLSAESVATALVAMDDPQMRARAKAIGTGIREEDGVGAACDFLEARVRPRR
ncbi:MAG: glycosyltransferase [Devosia sp.]